MPTLEKRVQALEQENAARKREHELLTITVNALVSKEAFEKIQEQNSRLFDVLNNHNILTNERLGDLQTQLIEQDGKIVGLQTEMRQRFAEQDDKITALDGKVVGLQTEMRQRFAEQDGKITALDGKITGVQTEMRQRFAEQDGKITALDGKVAALDGKVVALDGKVAALDGKITGVQTIQAEQMTLLQQILARLPEKP